MSNDSSVHHAVIVEALGRNGWAVCENYLLTAEGGLLSSESQTAWEDGNFRRAGVGRGNNLKVREEIRNDHVMWLGSGETTAAQNAYLTLLETLRLSINQRLFLGLFDFEGHFAIYPEGAYYKPHLDRHHQTSDRIVTVILYLNESWQPGDGGELKLWTTPDSQEGDFQIIQPRLGTLVCFMAGDHWHEVLPACKTRKSITGWFRVRA